MAEIKVLPSEIYNRISAGEVIEAPQSIVKELLENSIDAGAKNVDIFIMGGGKYIKVVDDGIGMSSDDMPTAFCAHATSKIKSIEDLDSINTLGFRGEALPSISSVATVTAISRKESSELGYKIIVNGSKITDEGELGCSIGTTIIVENLFENMPARLKFLKSDRAEESGIINVVNKIVLANYDISITLTVNDKRVVMSSGSGIKDAIFSVYGNKFVNEMMYIEGNNMGISLYGYINKPNYARHNRSYQTLVVNGRYVINSDISFWVYNCMQTYLMKRQYPAFVLYINLPFDFVDINVHPSKLEVKFVNYDIVRRLITTAISTAISNMMGVAKEIQICSDDNDVESVIKNETFAIPNYTGEKLIGNVDNKVSSALNFAMNSFDGSLNEQPSYMSGNSFKHSNNNNNCKIKQSKFDEDYVDTFNNINIKASKTSFYDDAVNLKLCGNIFNTYLILENVDDKQIYMIDQHAMHEKILYDQLYKNINECTNNTQMLLAPYVFELSSQDAEIFESCINDLKSMGFEITELSGNTYSLSGLPMIFAEMSMGEFVNNLIESVRVNRVKKSEFIKDKIAQSSCKSAIKGGMKLSNEDMILLVRQAIENNVELFCPHGRPIVVKITKTEIEKWFKRI